MEEFAGLPFLLRCDPFLNVVKALVEDFASCGPAVFAIAGLGAFERVNNR